MPKYELSKSFEAVRLNKRTGLPLSEPPVTIPFGAIVNDIELSGDNYTFVYMSDRFQVKRDVIAGAYHLLGGAAPRSAPQAEPEPEQAMCASQPGAGPDARPLLQFERLRSGGGIALSRAKIPGGWLVAATGGGIAFVPDFGHTWDGGSL